MKVFVTPHHLGVDGLLSTARAIEGLPGRHRVERASDGALNLNAGRLIVETSDPDFLIFAVENQGYAKSAALAEREEGEGD